MTKYEITKNEHGDIEGCSCCASEVATADFSNDREIKRLCFLCAHTIGHGDTEVTKSMLAQMLHAFRVME